MGLNSIEKLNPFPCYYGVLCSCWDRCEPELITFVLHINISCTNNGQDTNSSQICAPNAIYDIN